MRTLIFDTETTGLVNWREKDLRKQPHLVQLGAILREGDEVRAELNLIVNPGVPIPKAASDVHGVDAGIAQRYGVAPLVAVSMFNNLLKLSDRIACHNIAFDFLVMRAAYKRFDRSAELLEKVPQVCTMLSSMDVVAIPNPNKHFGGFKWPTLSEAHKFLFGEDFEGAHDAMADVRATDRVLVALENRGVTLKAKK